MARFDLSVIRPIKGKPGELVFELTVTDDNITDAVAYAYNLVGRDSGLLVLQTSSVIHDKVVDPAERKAVLEKLGINEPFDYDAHRARVEFNQREKKLDDLAAASRHPEGWAVADTSV